MKKFLLTFSLLFGLAATMAADPTAKAIYCASNTTLYFTYDEVTYNTSTSYEQLDGNTPTKVYDNISSTGYGEQKYTVLNGRVYAKDLKTPWVKDYWENITIVKILDNFTEWKPTKLDGYFFNLQYLTTIVGGSHLNTSEVTTFYQTFQQCYGLTDLSAISQWDLSNLESLNSTFSSCRGLTSLEDIADWDVSHANALNSTFSSCIGLTSLAGIANWDVSNVNSLNTTFGGCGGLTSLAGIANWDVSNANSLNNTFSSCAGLTNLHGLENWNVSNVKSLNGTFSSCSKLINVDALSDWNVSGVETLTYCFSFCDKLSNIDGLSDWNIGNVTNLGVTFYKCYALTNVDALSEWDTSKVLYMNSLVGYDAALENIEGFRNWDVSNVIDCEFAFGECTKLQSLEPIYHWNLQNCRDFMMMFSNCKSLTGHIDFSNWDLSHVAFSFNEELGAWSNDNFFQSMFLNCSNVKGISFGKGTIGTYNLRDFYDTTAYPSYVYGQYLPFATFSGVFRGCTSLRYIDLSGCTDPYGNITAVDRDGIITEKLKNNITYTTYDPFYGVPRTCVIYLPSGNGQPTNYNAEDEVSNLENVVYTVSDGLQCDKYYSEDAVDIELPHDFHADVATYERTFGSQHGGVILPYPVKINDDDNDEFQPYLLRKEIPNHMYFEGVAEVPANTPFAFLRKGDTDMKFEMSDVEVQNTYAISGETGDNIDPDFAWKTQGFYVNHEIEPVNGKFAIPTMDDYEAYTYNTNNTSNVEYDIDRVYYIASDKFWQCKNAKLTIKPHRILFYGMWEKFDDSTSATSFDFTEYDGTNAITEADALPFESVTEIYDITGRQQQQMGRGLNVVRMSDGTVRKVIVK